MAETPMSNLTPMEDIREYSVQSQYSASPHILALGKGFREVLDLEPAVELFYTKVFDISTAEGWGLDNWGRILGISRGNFIDNWSDWFGFNQSELQPFNQGVFYNTDFAISYQDLSDDAYRRLLMYKAMANIASADAATLNKLMTALFDDTFVYAIPVDVMKLRFVFDGYLENYDWVLLRNYGIFAKPAGVGWEMYAIDLDNTFGFFGSGLQPFNCGAFDTYGIIDVSNDYNIVPN